jgi:hypothetical protein
MNTSRSAPALASCPCTDREDLSLEAETHINLSQLWAKLDVFAKVRVSQLAGVTELHPRELRIDPVRDRQVVLERLISISAYGIRTRPPSIR